MNLENIQEFLQNQVLDIRVTKNARFMDQKCTPDVISTIAECIQNYSNESFCVRDIWESEFASNTVTRFFQKPNTLNITTSNEYDKFFGQPIKLLEYAGIIKLDLTRKGRSNYYKIVNKVILDRIAVSDKKSFDFLVVYLNEVLYQSGIISWFDRFFSKQSQIEFSQLKIKFENYIIKYTAINQKVEVRRIFTKILNPLAVEKQKAGTRLGRYSKSNILYDELLYNRLNFRDLNKPKDMPRAVFIEQNSLNNEKIIYNIEKAKRQVKQYQGEVSEIHPNIMANANHAHHIFPQSTYLELSDTLENLIVLTAEEHFDFAHKKSSTSTISLGYQMVCLLCKISNISHSINIKNDDFYSLDSYINILEVGLNTTIIASSTKKLVSNIDELRLFIIDFYLSNFSNNSQRIDSTELLHIICSLSKAESLILSDKLIERINNLFSSEILRQGEYGTKQTLNKIANLSLEEI